VTGVIGTSPARARDAELLTGRGRFVADIDLPGQVWARIVRSPVAHARLIRVGVERARSHPGVVAVLTADDIPDLRVPIRLQFAATPEAGRALQPLLARHAVRYVGEPVAVVVASSPWVGEDAAELVELELDLLDAPADVVSAAAPGATLVHEELGSNVLNTIPVRYGDLEAAFAKAAVVVRRRLRIGRQTGAPLETRGLLADPDGAGGLTVWGAAKVKHFNREATAELLGVEPASLRLVEVDVGGGFGSRGELYPEDVLVPLLALRLGRPVKWVEDRAEHLVAANHARGQVHELELAADRDGRLLALRGTHWVDQGAYVRTQGILPAILPAHHLPGPYRWEAFAVTAHAVLTHRTPVGTYRGPGMTEAAFVRERLLDILAGELGLDPLELRRRNLVASREMPFVYDLGPESPPIAYESGNFPACFERLLDEAGYEGLVSERDRRRAAGEHVGIGVAATVELGAIGPFEEATVLAEADGTFVVRAGVASLGQGIETALAQIAADELGVDLDAVCVHHHDTREVTSGFGSFASRSTVVAGNAVAAACGAFRAEAAAALGSTADAVRIVGGLARAGDRELQLTALGEARGRFEQPHPSFSFGASLSMVSVDVETGLVTPLRHVVAHDVGRAVNPALVEGQLVGAAVQGIGGALLEELPFDEQGQPLAVSLADYRLPTLAETPAVQAVLIESSVPGNPLGLKGAGEAGMVGAPAAVANAVADALAERGGDIVELPLTPQRIDAILAERP
jgi:carbon-monoxide dehydrogenase large subunit